MVQNKRQGFISGSCLLLLLICLSVAWSLGKGLDQAIRASRQDLDAIYAQLVFERNMIRLNQGKNFEPWDKGSYRVILTPADGHMWLYLLDESQIREELCIAKGDSSFEN